MTATFTCEITLPEKIIKVLGLRESEAASAIKRELAVYLFQRSMLSFGQARQLADLPLWDFLDLLRERKVPLHYGAAELEEDLKTVQEMG